MAADAAQAGSGKAAQAPRIALFTLESLAGAEAVAEFCRAWPNVVMMGLSDPYRKNAGGLIGQSWRRLRRSGAGILPYLAVNFTLPTLAVGLRGGGLAAGARAKGIPVMTIGDVNSAACREAIRRSGAELIVSFHFDQIFTPQTLECVPRGGVNVHPSLLPRHRGPCPTFWALQENPQALAVSVHRLAPRIDAGDILAQRTVACRAGLSASGAARLLHLAGVALLLEVLAKDHDAVARPQTELSPYQGFPTRAERAKAARAGVRLVTAADWAQAIALPRRVREIFNR